MLIQGLAIQVIITLHDTTDLQHQNHTRCRRRHSMEPRTHCAPRLRTSGCPLLKPLRYQILRLRIGCGSSRGEDDNRVIRTLINGIQRAMPYLDTTTDPAHKLSPRTGEQLATRHPGSIHAHAGCSQSEAQALFSQESRWFAHLSCVRPHPYTRELDRIRNPSSRTIYRKLYPNATADPQLVRATSSNAILDAVGLVYFSCTSVTFYPVTFPRTARPCRLRPSTRCSRSDSNNSYYY